jgi:glyoxylase I family protein
MKLSHLMIFAPDLDAAQHFYGDVLGFTFVCALDHGLRFEGEGCHLDIFRCERPGQVGDYSKEGRTVFVFEVPDLAGRMADLSSKGVRFLHHTPGENAFGRYAAFVDPFDNVHELFERKRN